jgi:hypothetical protein
VVNDHLFLSDHKKGEMNETSMVAFDISGFGHFRPNIVQKGCFDDWRDNSERVCDTRISYAGFQPRRFFRIGPLYHQHDGMADRPFKDNVKFCLSICRSHICFGDALGPHCLSRTNPNFTLFGDSIDLLWVLVVFSGLESV